MTTEGTGTAGRPGTITATGTTTTGTGTTITAIDTMKIATATTRTAIGGRIAGKTAGTSARIAARTSVSAARCAGWNRRIRPRGRTRRTRSSSSHRCSKGTIAPDPASFAPPKRPGPRPLGPGPFLVRSTWPCAEGEIEICGCVDMEALSQAYRALGDATRLR